MTEETKLSKKKWKTNTLEEVRSWKLAYSLLIIMMTHFIAICSEMVCFNLNQGSSMLILTVVIGRAGNHSVMPSVG